MTLVDPRWALDSLVRDFQPYPAWRDWFAQAYRQAIESASASERLAGWKTAAVIFGDMHVPLFCLFVCHHARSLVPEDPEALLGHIHLCLWELGLASPAQVDRWGAVRHLSRAGAFDQDTEQTEAWFAEQLQPFGGKVTRAATFAMRLTAVRYGLLEGPADPSIAELLDETRWVRVDRGTCAPALERSLKERRTWRMLGSTWSLTVPQSAAELVEAVRGLPRWHPNRDGFWDGTGLVDDRHPVEASEQGFYFCVPPYQLMGVACRGTFSPSGAGTRVDFQVEPQGPFVIFFSLLLSPLLLIWTWGIWSVSPWLAVGVPVVIIVLLAAMVGFSIRYKVRWVRRRITEVFARLAPQGQSPRGAE